MRAKVNQRVAEARIVKRYRRLHTPLVELIQSLQDLVPNGMQLGDKVELTQTDGYIDIAYVAKPIEVVINDGRRRFSLRLEEISEQQKEQ